MGNAPVLTVVEGRVGRIRLNRPDALNALTTPMCAPMLDALNGWADDPAIALVLIDHVAGRAFCAGGDIRMLAESGAGDGQAAEAFFDVEYRLNHRLFTYPKPTVALMDGITMGGGVGLSLPCALRVATARTRLAMPETAIGLFPDVGGGWYLSRLPGRLGRYLALTGHRLDGAECRAFGLATHYVGGDGLDVLRAALIADPDAAEVVLDRAALAPPPAALAAHLPDIARHFASDRLEDILASLASDESDWARAQLDLLRSRSPLSCKVSLDLLRRGAAQPDFAAEMAQEYVVACHMVRSHDFIEGVRALIVDKDNAPRWDPATPEEVTQAMVDVVFAPLAEGWRP